MKTMAIILMVVAFLAGSVWAGGGRTMPPRDTDALLGMCLFLDKWIAGEELPPIGYVGAGMCAGFITAIQFEMFETKQICPIQIKAERDASEVFRRLKALPPEANITATAVVREVLAKNYSCR